MFFKKRRRPQRSGPTLSREQAFDAKPVALPIDKRQPLANGSLRLIVSFQPRGYQRWLLRVPENATRQIELDAAGVQVFDMCDGRTSVRQMARQFAKAHKVDRQEAEVAVTAFIRSMMQRGLVSVVVDRK